MSGPNVAMLGNWIRSWIQDRGAVYGFHNHSVWGGNPMRWRDWTSGHSTWASPFLAGLADAIGRHPNDEAKALLETLVRYQAGSFQENGNYKHIGFQVGESLKIGLIHNAIANASLASVALAARDFLEPGLLDMIQAAFDRNTAWHGRATVHATCNQEYCRIWGKLLYQKAFDDQRWYDEIPEDLDVMLTNFHVGGFPDDDCEGTLRGVAYQEAVEPAEYYGLMILPLLMAYEEYGDERYRRHAGRLCRHVARSAWTDERGHVRFHRLWYRLDADSADWKRNREPMLISGMGDTLQGMRAYLRHAADDELAAFVAHCDATYAAYQNPRGYFAAATGWDSEIDVAPSSAWHGHDFRYLVRQAPIDDAFWQTFFAPYSRTSALLGSQTLWIERGPHWMISDYFWQDVYQILGRKDEKIFGRDVSWFGGPFALGDQFKFADPPVFLKDDDAIYLLEGDPAELDVTSVARQKVVM